MIMKKVRKKLVAREKKEMKNGQTDRPKQQREGKKAIESKIVTLVYYYYYFIISNTQNNNDE